MVTEQILSYIADWAGGGGGNYKSETTPLEGNGQYLSAENRKSRNANI